MRKYPIIILCLITGLLHGCGTVEQKLSGTLNRKGTNVVPIVASPSFDEPSEAFRSIYLVECPKCKAKQFLVPFRILTSGSTVVTNGNLAERTLYFTCSKRICKSPITIYDQVLVEPVKAVRVR